LPEIKRFKKGCDNSLSSTLGIVLYNILTELEIHMKKVRLIKMCLNETYSEVRIGKLYLIVFISRSGLKQGDTLSPLLFSVALYYAIRKV
jgi:hypothetical protein